jgi:hypothetical protein
MEGSSSDPALVQLLSDTEAYAICAAAKQRLANAGCSMPKERRVEVKWAVTRCGKYLEDAPSPVVAKRVLDVLGGMGLSEMVRLKLLNARATTEVAAFLADPEGVHDPLGAAEAIAGAWKEIKGGAGAGAAGNKE